MISINLNLQYLQRRIKEFMLLNQSLVTAGPCK